MKDMATKIAELKFEAPLACFEEEESSTIRNINIFSGMFSFITFNTSKFNI